MARIRYIDYRAEDSTELLNNTLRGVLRSGVYIGFNVGVGSGGGWWLKFTHDTDPDNTGEVLGVFVSPDGVVITEDANQDDVVLGVAPGVADEIHWVVASYTYNQALPNNDVVYFVKTAVAPATPVLTDDEILLAEINVPTGSGSYGAAGVVIKTVAKKSLEDINDFNLFTKFTDILDPGIYDGMELTEGSAPLNVNLGAGTWITQENAKIVEAALQADLFTLTNPGGNFYRLSWIVGMHKNEDTDPQPDVDYLLVEGASVALGTEAVIPTDGTILVAAAAIDSKYDAATYINKIGYIRTENRAGTYFIKYYRGETVLAPEEITVYGANAQSLQRSGKYYGHIGLRAAIVDTYVQSQLRDDITDKPYTILLDGDFQLEDLYLTIPSHIKLQGLGAPAIIESDESTLGVVRAVGFEATYDLANQTIVPAVWVLGVPPAGYDAYTFEIQATYRVGEDLVARMFSKGDRMVVTDFTGGVLGNVYDCTFQEYDTSANNWTINVFIENQYALDFDPIDVILFVYKQNIHFENIDIDRRTTAGDGLLVMEYLDRVHIDKVKVRQLSMTGLNDSIFGYLEVDDDIVNWSDGQNNKYDYLKLNCPQAALTVGDIAEFGGDVGVVEYTSPLTVITLTISFGGFCRIGRISLRSAAAGSALYINSVNCSIEFVENKATNGDVFIDLAKQTTIIRCEATRHIEYTANADNDIIISAAIGAAGTFTNSGDVSNKVLHIDHGVDDDAQSQLEHPNSDRNLHLVSDASITWDSTTGILEWTDVLRFDTPWTTGYTEIAAGTATLGTDGDRLWVDINRGGLGISVVVASVRTKAAASGDRQQKNRVFLALRYGNVIYLYDGTRIENGQTVKVGSTPPPDGSVTYVKLAPTAVAYHNQFFRDYVAPINSDGWGDSVVLLLDGIIVYTYTPATGIIHYTTPVNLLPVQPGDMVILRQTSFNPGVAGSGAFTFEEIFEVDDVNDNVRIAIGLDPTVGAANRWNGAIVRGNKVISNDDGTGTPIAYTYDSANGRVTYANTLGFNDIMVRPGMVWLDSALKKWRIVGVDPAGQYVDIDVRRRDVDATPPTSILQGSIEKNNNPYDLPMSDLSCAAGMEFVPIDGFGKIEVKEDYLVRGQNSLAANNSLATLDRRYSEPYDPRIRLRMIPLNRPQYEACVNDYTDSKLHMGNNGVRFVELTAVCSGAVLVVAGVLAASSSTLHPLVDGVENANVVGGINDLALDSVVYTNTYGNEVGRYEIMAGSLGACQVMEGFRLPVGVHHFMWPIEPEWQIRGVLIVKHPGYDGTLGAVVSDSPGQYVSQGEVLTKESLTRSTAIPVDPRVPATGWDKGSRMVRYLDKDGVYSFASTFIENFVDVGNIAGGVAITGTSNNKWKVGDIVMAFDGAGVKNLRRISSIVGTTLNTWGNPWTFVDPIAKLYYYGSTYDSAHDRRDYEEIIAQYNVLEFAAPEGNGISDSRSTVFRNGTARGGTTPIGIRLTDLSTGIKASDTLDQETGGAIQLDAASDEIQIRFVGSGLSINRESTGTSTIYIDDVEVYCFPATTLLDMDDDPGGTFICGNLPYGQHIVRILRTAGTFLLNAITVWGPKKPTIPFADLPALELLDTNVLAAPVSSYGIDPVDGPDEIQFGTIQLEVGRFYHPITHSSPLEDKPDTVITQSTHARTMGYDGVSAPHTIDAISIPFFGTEITLVTKTITLGGATFPVTVMDHDGAFKAPSALTGFVVIGVDTLAADATNGHRNRWVFSELAFHILQLNVGGVPGAPGADVLDIDAVEIHTPFHVYKTKQPVAIDHFMPFQFGGMDVRNLTPFRAEWLPGTDKAHVQSAQFHFTPVEWINQRAFVFYSRGGLTEISAVVRATSNTTTISVTMVVDGIIDSFGLIQEVPIAADVGAICLTRAIYLSPGFHFAYISIDSTGANYTIAGVNWIARSITHQSTHIASRGFGVPLLGPAGSSESSF